jgi:pimeloyl-ACP methyl ester carboxylesterase
MDLNTWTKNLDQLAEEFKVYAVDLWGQGYSTRGFLDYGYDLFEEQVRLFMDAMGIERTSLVGHSMGGGTSVVFALRNREMVSKLVLVGSTSITTRLPFRSKIFRLKGVAEFLMALRSDRVRRMNYEDFWVNEPDSLTEDYYQKFTCYQKVEGSTEVLLTILRKDFFNTLENEIQELGQFDIPTLIVWGRNDKTLPLFCAEEINRLMPGSRLEILDDAAHLANFDRPDTFNKLVIDFLSD